MPLRTIAQAKKLAGKVALVRLDANVPLKGNKIQDDSRLREALPTLRYLERHGAHVILVGHLGRPAGKLVAKLSLKPIGYALGKLLRQPVKVLPLALGPKALRKAAQQGVVMLENIRFEPGEESNDPKLGKQLAALADVFVNEAFSVSHRRAASLVEVARHLPSYAGFGLTAEVEALERIRKMGVKPVVAVIGGAKVADKLPVIVKLLPRVKAVLTGGGVGNTFLAAKGYKVGKSLIDTEALPAAKALLRRASKKIVWPVDVITDAVTTKKHESSWRAADEIKNNERVVDLGTRTTLLYAEFLKQAKTIFWSGPIGIVEEHTWSHATSALAKLAAARAKRAAYVLVGGGDTVNFFHQHNLEVDHFSLAGGAMLEFLAGDKLPGLTALGYA